MSENTDKKELEKLLKEAVENFKKWPFKNLPRGPLASFPLPPVLPAREWKFKPGDWVRIAKNCAFKEGTIVKVIGTPRTSPLGHYTCTYDGVHILQVLENDMEKANGIEVAKSRHGL